MNLLLITPYLEQKKGPFVWAKNFYEHYSSHYGNIYILTFDEDSDRSNYENILVHRGLSLEKKMLRYPFISFIPSIIAAEKRNNIDVIQTNDTLTAFCALMAKKITGIPVVLRIGGEYFSEINEWSEQLSTFKNVKNRMLSKMLISLFKNLGCYTMRRVDRLISVNLYMHNYLLNYGFDSIIIPNAIDTSKYNLNNSHLSGECLLCISNMDVTKKVEGVKILLDALLILKLDNFKVKLNIVGDGTLKDYLENYAKKIGVQDNVKFLGVRKDIPKLLGKCSIYVHSSLQDVFPNSILEAMASKKPVIAINVGGVSEIITHNSNGILCSPTSKALAKSLILLLRDDNLTERIRYAGYESVNKKYSWPRIVELYFSQYQMVCN